MPSVATPLEKAQFALVSNDISLEEKASALSTFSASLGDHIDADQAQSILTILPLSQLYDTLSQYSDDHQTESSGSITTILCDLIRKLLAPFPYSLVSEGENRIYLEQGLQHFSPSIRYLSLQQLEKCLNSNIDTMNMLNSNLLPMLATTLAFQDTRVASKAVHILYTSCLHEGARAQFFCSSAIQLLKSIMQINGTVGFRVYDLVIRIAASSDEAFSLCESSGLLNQLLAELSTDDLLLRMNAIQLLNDVAASPSGLQFLIRAQLMEKLVNTLDIEDDQDVAVALTKCAVLKFFGSLGANKDVDFTSIQQSYQVLERLEKCIDSTNKEIESVTLTCVGLIGCHLNGLALIQNTSSLLVKFFELARTASSDDKVVVLQSLSKLIGVSDDEGPAEEVERHTRAIYQSMPEYPSVINALMATAKQPVENTRLAAFALLESIASHEWGRQEISRSFEFLGYLLDRSNEYSQMGQMWKYAIVKALLADGSDTEALFGRHYSMLTQYLRQGPYYRSTQVTTAMESG